MSNCFVSGKLIAGCYEEDQDLMNQEQYFYSSTLLAWDKFRAGDLGAAHCVEDGKLERLLTPVSELARASFLVDGVEWQYRDKFGCILRAQADCAEVTQVLLQDGNRYIRCCKYWMQGLQYVQGEKGWVPYDNAPQGLEHLFVHRHANTVFSRLFLPEWEGMDKQLAMYEVQDEYSLCMDQISRELLSNY